MGAYLKWNPSEILAVLVSESLGENMKNLWHRNQKGSISSPKQPRTVSDSGKMIKQNSNLWIITHQSSLEQSTLPFRDSASRSWGSWRIRMTWLIFASSFPGKNQRNHLDIGTLRCHQQTYIYIVVPKKKLSDSFTEIYSVLWPESVYIQ